MRCFTDGIPERGLVDVRGFRPRRSNKSIECSMQTASVGSRRIASSRSVDGPLVVPFHTPDCSATDVRRSHSSGSRPIAWFHSDERLVELSLCSRRPSREGCETPLDRDRSESLARGRRASGHIRSRVVPEPPSPPIRVGVVGFPGNHVVEIVESQVRRQYDLVAIDQALRLPVQRCEKQPITLDSLNAETQIGPSSAPSSQRRRASHRNSSRRPGNRLRSPSRLYACLVDIRLLRGAR